MHSVAATILKYSPEQARGEKGTSQGGRFIRMDWGSMEAEEPSPHEVRRGEVDMARTAFFDRARSVAGPKVLADVAGRTHVYETGTHDTPSYETPEVRAAMKRQIHADLVARLRKKEAFEDFTDQQLSNFVQSKIDLWAETSADSVEEAAAMQWAVKQEFGLDAPTNHIPAKFSQTVGEGARNRAFVRAEYERTQEFLKSKGLTHLSVFRGMASEEGDLPKLGITDATMQPASSWTTDLDTAMEFAKAGVTDTPLYGDTMRGHRVVLTSRVPIEHVLSTCVTGRGCLAEQEVMLLGRAQRMHVYDLSLEDEDDPDNEKANDKADRVRRRIKAAMK